MCNDVPSNRLLGVRIEHCAGPTIYLGDDLVRNDDCDAKLVGKSLQGTHEFGKVHLTVGELAATVEVGAVERGCAVDDEERKAGLSHHLSGLVEQGQLVF